MERSTAKKKEAMPGSLPVNHRLVLPDPNGLQSSGAQWGLRLRKRPPPVSPILWATYSPRAAVLSSPDQEPLLQNCGGAAPGFGGGAEGQGQETPYPE